MPISAELWQLASYLRDRGESDVGNLLTEAKKRGISVDVGLLRELPASMTRGLWIVPDALVDVVATLGKELRATSVLDPWAGVGQFIIPLVEEIKPLRSAAITMTDREAEIATIFTHTDALEWIAGDPLTQLDHVGQFDMIVSCPPFGHRGTVDELFIEETTIHDDYGNLLVAKACANNLSADGYGIFALPPSFLFRATLKNSRWCDIIEFDER